MNFIKCAKCGEENPAFDYAHLCGLVQVKQAVTNSRIQQLAQQAGDDWDHTMPEDREFLERFANLVAAHEREECLKLVSEQIHNMTVLDSYPEQSGAIYQAIINIRAREEK